MKKLLVLLFLLIFSGCYQRIDTSEIKKAECFCKDKGGVLYIDEVFIGYTDIVCMDGSYSVEEDIKCNE